jgi:hypothetical protein
MVKSNTDILAPRETAISTTSFDAAFLCGEDKPKYPMMTGVSKIALKPLNLVLTSGALLTSNSVSSFIAL